MHVLKKPAKGPLNMIVNAALHMDTSFYIYNPCHCRSECICVRDI